MRQATLPQPETVVVHRSKALWPMSALGQKRTWQRILLMSALPPKADKLSRGMSALCQKRTLTGLLDHPPSRPRWQQFVILRVWVRRILNCKTKCHDRNGRGNTRLKLLMMNHARAFAALIPPLQSIDDCWSHGERARTRMYASARPPLGMSAACTNSKLVNTCFLHAPLV
jgi:hypothetical protein